MLSNLKNYITTIFVYFDFLLSCNSIYTPYKVYKHDSLILLFKKNSNKIKDIDWIY